MVWIMIKPGSLWQIPIFPGLHFNVIDRMFFILNIHIHPDRFGVYRDVYSFLPLRILNLFDLCFKDGFQKWLTTFWICHHGTEHQVILDSDWLKP